jgi:hypothetical protein
MSRKAVSSTMPEPSVADSRRLMYTLIEPIVRLLGGGRRAGVGRSRMLFRRQTGLDSRLPRLGRGSLHLSDRGDIKV